MKRKEFKEYLKNEIVEILSEVSKEDVDAQKEYNTELEKTLALSKEVGLTEDEDSEPTSADLKKKDSVATTAKKLQKIVAKMKGLAKEFKEAKGDLKDQIKDKLKDLTAEKKKLEKNL